MCDQRKDFTLGVNYLRKPGCLSLGEGKQTAVRRFLKCEAVRILTCLNSSSCFGCRFDGDGYPSKTTTFRLFCNPGPLLNRKFLQVGVRMIRLGVFRNVGKAHLKS